MPRDVSPTQLPLNIHIDMTFLALHYLKLKIRDMIKTDTIPDENAVTLIKILSNYLPEAKAEIDRSIKRLERHHVKLRRKSLQ